MHTPIALFAYNRKGHLAKTIQALQHCHLCSESDLFLFIDGPKNNATEIDFQAILEVNNYAKSITGFKSVKLIEQKHNLGLTQSVIQGISHVLQNHKAVIVLEDDMLVAPDFLTFMNQGVNQYENNPAVAGISGYAFPINEKLPYFTRTGSCWGWATFQRVWEDFLIQREKLNLNLIAENELKLFNVYNNVYSTMFIQNKQGLVQSWAIDFYLYYFSQKQYFLMPGINLVSNIGFDGSGAHQKHGNFLTDNNPIGHKLMMQFPAIVQEEKEIRKKIEQLYQKGYARPSLIKSFVNKIKSVLLGNENNNH